MFALSHAKPIMSLIFSQIVLQQHHIKLQVCDVNITQSNQYLSHIQGQELADDSYQS